MSTYGNNSGTALARSGQLQARPTRPRQTGPHGVQPLFSEYPRTGLLYVPETYEAQTPAPLVVTLHGAGGSATRTLSSLQSLADKTGTVLLVPDSQQATWDAIRGGFGPDVLSVDRALEHVFMNYQIDPQHIAINGFSDGASYALSLGITNGHLFTHVIAYSPGFMAPGAQDGTPRIFISHGTRDVVLPVDRCSRQLVPILEAAGYVVTYDEFDGPHTVPPSIAHKAFAWFLATANDAEQ